MTYEFKVSASGQKMGLILKLGGDPGKHLCVLQKWNCNWIHFVTWAAVTMWPVVEMKILILPPSKVYWRRDLTLRHNKGSPFINFHFPLPSFSQNDDRNICYSFIDDHRKLRSFKQSFVSKQRYFVATEKYPLRLMQHKDQSRCNIWMTESILISKLEWHNLLQLIQIFL